MVELQKNIEVKNEVVKMKIETSQIYQEGGMVSELNTIEQV
jgi:hypothetical protein